MGHYDLSRDGANYTFTFNWVGPSGFLSSAEFGSVNVDVVNAETGTVIAADVASTYVAALKAGRIVRPVADLDGVRAVVFVMKPVAGPTPDFRYAYSAQRNVTDMQKRQDEIEAKIDIVDSDVAALQTDFNNFETVNQGEHDATQSAISQIAVTARAQLLGPVVFEVPDSGTKTFVLEFIYRDTDSSPTTLVDPDSNQVDISVLNQAGGVPVGVTLAGTPAGRMTRDAAGRYSLVVTVASTATDDEQLRFTASFAKGGLADVAKWICMLDDFDQLDTIQAQVDAIRNTDVPAIQVNVDAAETAINANVDAAEVAILAQLNNATYGLSALNADLDSLLARIGVDGAVTLHQKLGAFTSSENLKAILGDLSTAKRLGQILGAFTEASNIKALLGSLTPTDNLYAVLGAYTAASSLKTAIGSNTEAATDPSLGSGTVFSKLRGAGDDLDVIKGSLTFIGSQIGTSQTTIQAKLDNATYGLIALNADLDALLARLGITTDLGGSQTAGTAMAKLNAIYQQMASLAGTADVEVDQPIPPQSG